MCCRHPCSLVCNPVCVCMFERVATYIKRAKTKNDEPQRLSPAGTQSSLEALCIAGRIWVWVLSRRCCCSAVCGGTCCTKPDSCTHWRKKSQLDHSISCQKSPSHSDKQTHSDRNACVQFSIHSLPKKYPLVGRLLSQAPKASRLLCHLQSQTLPTQLCCKDTQYWVCSGMR